jgi:dTDP-4-dehydrorhamnose reductase
VIPTVPVLVFGKNGQVGSNLVRILGQLPGFDVLGVDIDEIDLTQTDGIESFITKCSPRWVINASAHTAVDKAESEQELSFKLNAAAPEEMAKACALTGTGFVHYSTDYVFDGAASEPYVESDPANPKSVYGRSKLQGEVSVLSQLPDAIILRTSWVYDKTGHNFVNTMLRLVETRTELQVVNDQFGSPTLADDLARVTVNILNGVTSGRHNHQGGVFHATGQGHTSWYGFCKEIMKITGNHEVTLTPVTTSEFPTIAPRPAYSVLSNRKLEYTYQQKLPHWRDALYRCLDGG